MTYDSRADTLLHARRVGELLAAVQAELALRAVSHDASKVEPPEVAVFDEFTPRLKDTEYGSQEYKDCLAGMSVALKHHYAESPHHPDHFENGIAGMTLVDLLEMLADWRASTERNKNGSLAISLPIQRERFGINPQLMSVLENTAIHFGWLGSPAAGEEGQ